MAVVGSFSLLHSTALCDYITIYPALDGYLGYFQFVVSISNAAMNILCLSFRGAYAYISVRYIPRSGITGS